MRKIMDRSTKKTSYVAFKRTVLILTSLIAAINLLQTPQTHATPLDIHYYAVDNEPLDVITNFGSNDTGSSDVSNSRISLASLSKIAKPGEHAIKCGHPIKVNQARIVNGRLATIADFPWMVSIQKERDFWFGFKAFHHQCGGSIITPTWLVTASHCFYNRDTSGMRVVAGADNMDFLYRAQIRNVRKLVMHGKFDSATFDNDIALIQVDRPFDFQSKYSHVAPLCLERDVEALPYDIASICGFGAKTFRGRSRTHLYETDIAIVDQKTCNKSFDYEITDNMICAGGMFAHKRDACSGDSGGPLHLEMEDHVTLLGVVSFGNDCAMQGYPGIYTKVANYYNWIMKHIDEPLFDP